MDYYFIHCHGNLFSCHPFLSPKYTRGPCCQHGSRVYMGGKKKSFWSQHITISGPQMYWLASEQKSWSRRDEVVVPTALKAKGLPLSLSAAPVTRGATGAAGSKRFSPLSLRTPCWLWPAGRSGTKRVKQMLYDFNARSMSQVLSSDANQRLAALHQDFGRNKKKNRHSDTFNRHSRHPQSTATAARSLMKNLIRGRCYFYLLSYP